MCPLDKILGARSGRAFAITIAWPAVATLSLIALGVWFRIPEVRADDSAVIVNSGSTNTAGFRIVVERSGKAEFTPVPRRSGGEKPEPKHGTVPAPLVRRLYADLGAAKPLSSLPKPRCMKSVSFGTRLTIELGADSTPDLSCGDGGSAALAALLRDANEIVGLFTAQ